ncbi:hypothetical protein V6N13_103279 [Hibiscus sabdariffa]
MALSAVSSALQTIGNVVAQEAIYLWGVEEQVACLQTELKWMQSFLRKADAIQSRDETIRLWVAEIRELAYDAEDVIGDFALRIRPRKRNCIKRSACILKDGWMLHNTRSKIEKILTGVTDLVRRLQAYGIKELREEDSTSAERRESRRPYPHIIDEHIVGLDTAIKELVSVIVGEESESRVVSICGMGGLGKTTLAKKIYHHTQVVDHFDRLVWVYVSQQCQKRKVWTDILSGLNLSFQVDWKTRDEDIAKELFNYLKMTKCLVIVDDIWSNEAWDSIKPAFPEKETRTKILLTSRNTEVVSHADSRGYLYQLQCLNLEQSWELFRKIAFSQASAGREVEGRLEEVGKNMVEHCAGLPLAIVVLGGILATKDSVNEWQMVSENVISYLKRAKGHGVEEVLALSYDDLPHYLRPCFLYLANFPEDFEIEVDRLIQLWVAEGIVFSEEEDGIEGSITEDLAKRYLMELVERSKLPSSLGNLRRLQTLDLRARGGFWLDSLHVPDVIWRMEQLRHLYLPDECHRKTKLKLGTLRNLQTLVNFNTDNCFLRDLINMTNIRELVIRGAFEIEDFNAEDSDKNPAIIQGRHLHSLSIINTYGSIDPRHLKHLLSSCVSVCKLSLAVEISELPEYHHLSSDLTYIHLEASHLEEDPMPTLEKLPNLRVLELNTSAFKGKEMSCSAKGFPKLESLSLDWLYNLEEWKVDDGAMPCLRRLEIEKCRELKMIPDGLRYITTLQELKIERMPKAFRVRVEEGGEDFGKVQHVPSRIFKHCDE